MQINNIRTTALYWLCEPNANAKTVGVIAFSAQNLSACYADHIQLESQCIENRLSKIEALDLILKTEIPGRPLRPILVPPLALPKRSMRTVEGRAALIHALAHIEFNAINLSLDAIWRFENMPDNYYIDWLKVAGEEATHFSLLNAHLNTLGFAYGDFAGHDSLWEMVDRTKDCVLARMALVPRTMEARGLDALPALRAKLAQAGDLKAAQILDITLKDEIGHVAIGNYWFNWLCLKRGLVPIDTYYLLAQQYDAPKPRAPFNLDARRKAGFSEAELVLLYN